MIEKFNFYDLYGYLIPGLLLFGLVWIPIGLLRHQWPSADFGGAILTVVFAYLLGHVMHGIANCILPAKIKDADGELRYPSNVLLDKPGTFSEKMLQRIEKRCKDTFEIEVKAGKTPKDLKDAWKATSDVRQEAFMRARSSLMRAGNKGYAEQFQGLYALMAGSSMGLFAGSFYFVGWAIAYVFGGQLQSHPLRLIGAEIVLFTAALALALQSQYLEETKEQTKEPKIAGSIDKERLVSEQTLSVIAAFISLSAGVILGTKILPNAAAAAQRWDFPWLMILLAAAGCVAAVRFYGSYRTFALEFAVTVWRDFGDMDSDPAPNKAGGS